MTYKSCTGVSFDATKEDLDLITKIVYRALGEGTRDTNRIKNAHMDLVACHCNGNPLDLKALLEADDFNFWHDVGGITENLNRTTGKLENHFLPRFTMSGDEELTDEEVNALDTEYQEKCANDMAESMARDAEADGRDDEAAALRGEVK